MTKEELEFELRAKTAELDIADGTIEKLIGERDAALSEIQEALEIIRSLNEENEELLAVGLKAHAVVKSLPSCVSIGCLRTATRFLYTTQRGRCQEHASIVYTQEELANDVSTATYADALRTLEEEFERRFVAKRRLQIKNDEGT
jgi:vacuolar-type H+-ATPase subunit I/STV1